jgi:selenide,water dikinase
MLRWTTKLNVTGTRLAEMAAVHAVTDVTGFGLAGHLLEICRGSRVAATVEFSRLPLIAEAVGHLKAGIVTGASSRNWSSYGEAVDLAPTLEEWQQKMVTDPQTSGGLLVACAADAADAVLEAFRADGFEQAAAIGYMNGGSTATPRLAVI